MKKIFALLAAVCAVTAVFAACGRTVSQDDSFPLEDSPQETQGETFQPDPLSPETETGENNTDEAPEQTSDSTEPNDTPEITTQGQHDPLGGGAFSYNEDGAVTFEGDSTQQDDRTLISAAQALFESACRTEWDFTVGCPYQLDINSYVENNFGWRFSRITNENINSFSDVQNDYFKVFSDRYPNQLSSLYLENNGSVYALNGARGMDLYYSASKITGIQSRTNDEIFFTVEHYYDGSDYGRDPYSETETFSVVIGEDGVWRAGQFRLPY